MDGKVDKSIISMSIYGVNHSTIREYLYSDCTPKYLGEHSHDICIRKKNRNGKNLGKYNNLSLLNSLNYVSWLRVKNHYCLMGFSVHTYECNSYKNYNTKQGEKGIYTVIRIPRL